MGLSIEEQETHINFMRGDNRAKIYTSDTTMMTKLNKLVELENTEWKLEYEEHLKRTGELIGKCYSCPVSFLTFRKKVISREYTDEQREQIGKRLREIKSNA